MELLRCFGLRVTGIVQISANLSQGRSVHLANVGDSRAVLVAPSGDSRRVTWDNG